MNIDPKIIEKIKARLSSAETTGGDYKAINDKAKKGTGDPTYALGKYQFVPSIWWKSIKSFAKENNYPPINKYDDFLNNPPLQEEFFNDYVQNTVIPKAKELMQYNKRNLDFDEIAQLVHMNNAGGAVKNYIQGRKFNIKNAENNMLPSQYLEKGRQGLELKGLGPVTPTELMSEEEIKEKTDGYFAEREKIMKSFDEGKTSEGAKNSLIENLNSKYGEQGLINKINLEAARRNSEKEALYKTDRANVAELYKKLQDDDDNFERVYEPEKGRLTLKGTNNYGKATIREFINNSGAKLRQNKRQAVDQEGNPVRPIFTNSITFDFKNGGKNANYLVDSINKYGKINEVMTLKKLGVDLGLKEKEGGFFESSPSPRLYREILFEKEMDETELIGTIDPDKYNRKLKKDLTEIVEDEPVKEKKVEAEQKTETETDPTSQVVDGVDYANLYEELEVEETPVYDSSNFKREIPFDAMISGFLGARGLAAADNEIPMRKEEISAGLTDYISKMQELSNIGLPPELEAKAKDSLANAAQLGMDNIVRASSGNRNLVLGNQSSLDLARMQGEVDLSVADFQAKVDAMNQYGEAMKYVNEFKANKDIANTQAQQRIALLDREAAGELAGAGFQGMIESIRSQREKAPGTPYHMLMSKYAMDAFGFIPGMEDNGQPGSKSYFLAQNEKINQQNKSVRNIKGILPNLDEGKKSVFDTISQKVGYDPNKISELATFIQNNDTSQMNLENTDAALKGNNYNLLFDQAPGAQEETMQQNVDNTGKISDIYKAYL